MSSISDIKQWIYDVFNISENCTVNVIEKYDLDELNNCVSVTEINIFANEKRSYSYNIRKPISFVTYEDILELRNLIKKYALNEHPIFAKLIRLFGWWFIFAGGLTVFSVCPVCGQVGCPVGIGTTGIIAGFFALIKQFGKQGIDYIKKRVKIVIN